ncbi:MAG: Hsp70 family protein [Pseudotabrizicola sp.]|uniref:Hsp70 family protein n=1 Tax=Pseudotabrizicola sp. TaxID=2939647 RepID=UPI00272F1B87|nr:Hsp70 family protein [Pseudotabrizicola sp.]MDP2079554.1 Hsp70 family protein [Pseudotabrizicola sp.]MDZ7572386.1 Hsp70 family protein [Pseudotabrizicola sp.]
MAQARVCGVDFGTSNSTVSIPAGNGAQLIALEGDNVTMPSAVFWDADGAPPQFGRAAMAAYVEGDDGRLMRGLKSALGSDLIHEKTRVGNRAIAFTQIIGRFFGQLRAKLEVAQPGTDHVVLGRPVHFVDDDAAGDQAAQDVLEAIAREAGFTQVGFQFEPIAAALDYESRITAEELVMIVDIGGGTTDFSVIRVSPDGARRADRSGDILANHGMRLGGTDLDRLLSLDHIMPDLGLGSLVHGGKAPMPQHYYLDLASWHRINAMYAPGVAREIKELRQRAVQPELLDRMLSVLEQRHGHALAMAAEAAKITLSDQSQTKIAIATFTGGRDKPLSRTAFEDTVATPVLRLTSGLAEVMRQAGVAPRDIGTVFMTGGSASLPVLRDAVARCLPGTPITTGDMFGSVGTGLALDAARRFA